MKAKQNPAHLLMEKYLRELGLDFRAEWQFFHERKWRFDYMLGGFVNSQCWHPGDTAIEIEGAVWTRGRHTRGKGYIADLEKYRTAAAIGIKVYRFSTQEVMNGTAKAFLERWR